MHNIHVQKIWTIKMIFTIELSNGKFVIYGKNTCSQGSHLIDFRVIALKV